MTVTVPTADEFTALAARVTKLEAAVFPPTPPVVPTDPTGLQAYRIADFLEITGTNCFPNAQDGAGPNASAAAYIKGLSAICGGSGMGMLHRLYGGQDAAFIQALCNAMAGTRFMSAVAWNQASLQNILAMIANPALKGLLVAVEGFNEPNNGGVQEGGQPVPVTTCLAVQQQLYAAAKPAGILTLLPSVIDDGDNYLQRYMGSSLQAFIAACDLANGHDYPNSGAPMRDMARRSAYLTQVTGKPAWIPEYNSLLYNVGRSPFDEQKSAYYAVAAMFDAFIDNKVRALTHYCMYDYAIDPPFEVPVGLFKGFDPTQLTMTAQCLQAMFQLCKDTSGAERHTFAPGKLNVTIAPALPAGGRLAVFQSRSTGQFGVFVGIEADQPGGTVNNYTLTFAGQRKRLREYWLTSTPAQSQVVRQDRTNAASFTLGLGNEFKLVQVDW